MGGDGLKDSMQIPMFTEDIQKSFSTLMSDYSLGGIMFV